MRNLSFARLAMAVVLAGGMAGAQTVDVSPAPARGREAGELRDPARIEALIDRLEEVRAGGDTLPLHAFDHALRKAVDSELLALGDRSERALALRLERAAKIANVEEARVRDEAYRTPLVSRPATTAPAPATVLAAPAAVPDAAAEAKRDDLEARRREVIRELGRVDPSLDDAGVAVRRELLLRLLSIAREGRALP